MAKTITLTSAIDGFAFTALHAEAQGPRKGGVVVIQEIFGLDQYVQADVARWAAKGFEAVAPSMFDRQEKGFIADHDPKGLETGVAYMTANGLDNPISDVQAAIDYLAPRGPVFIVGYCYGGVIAWLAAGKATGLSAAASYYGGRVAQSLGVAPKIPVICHFGRKDAHIPADETKAAINAAYPDLPVYIYEASGHGFNNDGRPDSDLADAELARKRSVELFEANGAK
ncbi:dienelactone hydrolase family protein [Caulobacter mirabilis]|uniref:Dienelactone hydrolase n=1 Tax=Caulobacter mirabilis TaxID=69666 RepID=A0A2D2AUY8_9CAUL|nr:dienelactone hydrolase family protein [Caulobacter mirabilis]ATQ41783.1 dienelactone hydrolase [Caulobacter mirabilis]